MKFSLLIPLIFSSFIWAGTLLASNPLSPTSLAVLPTTDHSLLKFSVPLQKGLGRLLEESRQFKPVLSSQALSGFSPDAIQSAMNQERVDSLSFALLETSRISVFFFHRSHPKEFIVQSQLFSDPKQLEEQLKLTVQNLLEAIAQEKYSLLPGQSEGDRKAPKFVYKSQKLENSSRRLFREFASISDSPFSLGAQVGMARFSNASGNSSTVTFELGGGYQFHPSFAFEAGISASTYLLGRAGIRYLIPIEEKVVRLSVGLDGATVMANIARNNTENTSLNSYYGPNLDSGSILAGPGFSFEIPLLGATLKGDLRFYTGSTSIFIGTYGFVYYL